MERRFLLGADAVVSLTASGAALMQESPFLRGRQPHFSVIPTCTNIDMFRRPSGFEPPAPADTTFVHLGTVGNPYLLDEVFRLVKIARRHGVPAQLQIVNRRDRAYIGERAAACEMPAGAIDIKSLEHGQVPASLWAATAGVVFITPTFCRRFCAPTKVGELLAAGLPCIANAGVGDLEQILEGERVGVVIRDFTDEALETGLKRLMALTATPGIAERCAEVAQRYFSLEDGVRSYDMLYQGLAPR